MQRRAHTPSLRRLHTAGFLSTPPPPLLTLSVARDFICLLIYFSSNNPPPSHFVASMYRNVRDAVNGISCIFSIYLAVNTKIFMHAAAWLTVLPGPHSESVVRHPLLNEWFVPDIPCVFFIFIYLFFLLPEGSFLLLSFLSRCSTPPASSRVQLSLSH